MGNNLERRYLRGTEIRVGNTETTGNTIEGYAARFGSESLPLFEARRGEFIEVIERGAFKTSLANNDIRALVNHDDAKVIGRTKSGTLTLREDDQGLWFSCTLPDTSYARDLAASLDRGDIDGCSFGFTVESEDIEYREDGTPLRRLLDVDLREVSLGVTFPAYPETTIALRSIERWERDQKAKSRHRVENAKKWLGLHR